MPAEISTQPWLHTRGPRLAGYRFGISNELGAKGVAGTKVQRLAQDRSVGERRSWPLQAVGGTKLPRRGTPPPPGDLSRASVLSSHFHPWLKAAPDAKQQHQIATGLNGDMQSSGVACCRCVRPRRPGQTLSDAKSAMQAARHNDKAFRTLCALLTALSLANRGGPFTPGTGALGLTQTQTQQVLVTSEPAL